MTTLLVSAYCLCLRPAGGISLGREGGRLFPGTYAIEDTTYAEYETGTYTLTMSGHR